tara:strand:- start:230 stop:1123 length:894 start_codon:yes stop_codon:yes gene_type:complete
MKLTELATPKKSRQVTQVFESYFGTKMPVNKLTVREAQAMLKRVRGVIAEHQRGTGRHTSERNPAYLKLVMMEQALAHRVSEDMVPPAPTTAPATSTQVDPKLKAAKDKLSKGQTLSPEEQQLINAQATMTAESRLRRAYQFLKESEVQQAQVVLAAQDMVDKMQSMLEDTTEMQFKELPALVDSIRNQIGIEQATQFNSDVTAALQGLVQNLQGSKQQLETALGVVTGQPAALDTSMAASGMPGAAPTPMPGAEAGAELGAEVGADVGADLGAEMGAEMGAEEPAPAGAALGRARR